MKKLAVLGMGVCIALAFSSCKSSESAYKKAYEKAKQQELAEPQTTAPAEEVAPVVTAPVEVKVVESAGYAAEQEQRGRSQRRCRGGTQRHQAQSGEDKGQCGGSEHFKEALHPQMHHPPAPVFHHGQVRAFAVEEATGVEQADGDDGEGKQREQIAIGTARRAQRWQDAAQHQHQPDCHADKFTDLPQAAQIDIFIALMTEPEIGGQIVEETMDSRPLSGKRADHDDQQADEQKVDPEPLKFRIAAGKHWRDI